jgi:hypothetical protein
MLVVAQAPGINGPADSAAGVTDGPVTEGMPTLNYFWRMNVYAKIARCQYLVSFGDVQWFDPTLPWVEDVPTPVEVYPVPGATLLSMQDLAVIPGGVDVNFATS